MEAKILWRFEVRLYERVYCWIRVNFTVGPHSEHCSPSILKRSWANGTINQSQNMYISCLTLLFYLYFLTVYARVVKQCKCYITGGFITTVMNIYKQNKHSDSSKARHVQCNIYLAHTLERPLYHYTIISSEMECNYITDHHLWHFFSARGHGIP